MESKYIEVNKEISIGARVKMRKNYQVGEVKEIRGRRAVVQIGALPMNVALADLVVVEAKERATL